jgi:nucleotide-binding universal stress UspA family protein
MLSLVALIDGWGNDAACLRAAAGIAKALGGKLTVAHFKKAEVLPVGAMEMGTVIPTSSASKQEALNRAESAYAEECSQLPGCCLEMMDCGVGEAIKYLSPYHDVIVLERLLETDGPDATAFSAALFDSRCAVLVSPSTRRSYDEVRHVALAWNGTAQAGRALRAAMPFLRKAAQATVLQRSGSGEDAELKRYLADHGIEQITFRAYGHGHLTGRGWGRALLAETTAVGADLLVMGAYGSSIGNLLGFGRATEKIVSSAPVPVLLSA